MAFLGVVVVTMCFLNLQALPLRCQFNWRPLTSSDDIKEYIDCLVELRDHTGGGEGYVDPASDGTLLGGGEVVDTVKHVKEDAWWLAKHLAVAPLPSWPRDQNETLPYDDNIMTFPYCAGMTESQCRSLVATLERLLASGAGGTRDDTTAADEWTKTLPSRDDDGDDDGEERNLAEVSLLNPIFVQFNEILSQYQQWRGGVVTGSINGVNGGGDSKSTSRPKRSLISAVSTNSQKSHDPAVIKTGDDDNVDLKWRQVMLELVNGEQTHSGGRQGKTSQGVQQPQREKQQSATANAGETRWKRSPNSLMQIPFKLPDKITPEMQAVLEGYVAWREKNGYGKMSGRWG